MINRTGDNPMKTACLATLLASTLLLATPAHTQTTLTFGGSDAIGSILDRQNLRFTACVNDKGTKLKVNFMQGEQLGSDVQVIEQMMQGSVQIYGDVLDWYANWVKDYAILAWGFTFRDADHMQKFLDSPTYAAMAEKLRKEQGLRILAAAPTQPRILFSKKPIGSLGDLNGVKMRVPEIKTYLTLWETLGTRPSRLAWGEIYLGLKTGVVEAAEGPISSAYSAKFHEAATNVIRTDHLMSSAHITVNDKAYHGAAADSRNCSATCAVRRPCRTRARRRKSKPKTWCARWPPKAPRSRRSTRHRSSSARRKAWPRWKKTAPGPRACGIRSRSSDRCRTRIKQLLDRIGAVEQGLGVALIRSWSSRSRSRCSPGTPSGGRSRGWRSPPPTRSSGWSFVGASLGLKQARHIVIATFGSRLPPRIAAVMRMLVWVLVLITLVVLIVQGIKVIGVEGRSTTISLPIELPRSWFYSLPLTLSAASMTLTTLYLLLVGVARAGVVVRACGTRCVWWCNHDAMDAVRPVRTAGRARGAGRIRDGPGVDRHHHVHAADSRCRSSCSAWAPGSIVSC